MISASVLRSGVRPIITYAFALAMVAGFLLKLISAEVFTNVAVTVISFWFASRSSDKRDAS